MLTPDTHTYADVVQHLQQFFEEGGTTGLSLDPELCLALADGLRDVHSFVLTMETFARSHGLVENDRVYLSRPRSKVERRRLAHAARQDGDTNVVRLPDLTPEWSLDPHLWPGGGVA